MYWGEQPIVEAPAYVGAVILFLFVFALFIVKGRMKWWLVAGTLLSLLLSYGKNFGVLTDFFIDYIPLYSKFRAVSSIQVILELCIPVLAILGLSKLLKKSEVDGKEKLNALKNSVYITSGIALVFLIFKTTFFDFVSINDGYYSQNYGPDFIRAIKEDRKSIFTEDTIRTLILVVLSAGIIFMFLKNKLKQSWVIVCFGVLILFDLVIVDKRYVNNEDFVSSISVNKPYHANAADLEILKDNSHFRVFDLTSSGARASYFHNSLSGYHAAPLKRYDELFDFYVAKNNINVLNMLNTKYIIMTNDTGEPLPYFNDEANGNAWFIKNFKVVNSANDEILALDSLNTKTTAVIKRDWIDKEKYSKQYTVDSSATISLIDYKPNYLKYYSTNNYKGFVVFSEIYYKAGWNSYIDGKAVTHSHVNYVLRGMEIPSGKHTIEFKFEPQVIQIGSSIVLASSVFVGILIILGLLYQFKQTKHDSA
jgi:hypothetical protein